MTPTDNYIARLRADVGEHRITPAELDGPVPQSEYIESLWASVKEGLITWPELRALQATYLRDLQPVPLPTIEEIRGAR